MKKLLLLCIALVLSIFFQSVAYAEVTPEDVVSSLQMAFSDGFDYCEIRYNADDSSLYVDVAIDGLAKGMYAAKEYGVDSTDEEWKQIKGMFMAVYYATISMFETCEIETPDYVCLSLWNDDVVIRDDHSIGKSRILLAINNGYFFIDEMEVAY